MVRALLDTVDMLPDPTLLAPSLIRPRRLHKIILGALLASTALGAVTLYAVGRMRDQAFADAAKRRQQIAEARVIAKQYAYEGFPAWVVSNPESLCPQRLAELDVFIDRRNTLDPWGMPFRGECHSGNTLRVVSAGPDRTHGTYDDIVEGT